MFDLNEITKFDNVVIQCHDNPDADALASAYALSRFLKGHEKDSEIIYSGYAPISKANLKLMLSELCIEARFIPKTDQSFQIPDSSLLIIVDGQYGAGNVRKFAAANVAVIDHHVPEGTPPALSDIRPYLGSCSTLVWVLLKKAGFSFLRHRKTSTALYYGLYTDTGSLTEISHPLDRDIRDSLRFDIALIKKLKNCNITHNDLLLAGKSLLNSRVHHESNSAVFYADPCDPNILGFISDLALQVETIETCVVFCEVSGGVKLSVRSCVKEVMASELAQRLCEGGGNGGGHADKAGGYISADFVAKSGMDPLEFMSKRFQNYFGEYDLIYAEKYKADLAEFGIYVKLKIPVGYVRTVNIYPAGTEITMRTIEGDEHVISDKETYIMVGIRQEVYAIKREKFERSYKTLKGAYSPRLDLLPEKHYAPSVKNRAEGVSKNIEKFIRPCVSRGTVEIYAKQLKKRTKVFNSWNPEGYMFGAPGDWIAIRKDDLHDVYIIENTIFFATYAARSGD